MGLMSTTNRPAAARPVPCFRSALPNGLVVVTQRMPRWLTGSTVFETSIVAPDGSASDPVRASTRGAALVVHNDVCDGVYGRGYRADVVLGMLLDLADGEMAVA